MTDSVREPVIAQGVVRVGPFGKLAWLPFEGLIAFLMITTGVRTLIDSDRVSVVGAPAEVSNFISIIYLIGGVSLILGLYKVWPKIEMFGLLCLVIGVSTGTVLSLIYHGASILLDIMVFGAVSISSFVRLYELVKSRDVVQIEVQDDLG